MSLAISEVTENASPRLKVVLAYFDALAISQDPKALGDLLLDDFTQTLLPKSLGRPVNDKATLLQFAQRVPFKSAEPDLHRVIETEDTVLCHITLKATSLTGAPYLNEYIFIFTVTEQADGTFKIKALEEFVDSAFVAAFFPAEMKRQAEAKAKGE